MSAPTPVVRAVMLERDVHRCVKCGIRHHLEAQHRQAVGMGGSKVRPKIHELVTACSEHNARFESDLQGQALKNGWKVPKWVGDCSLVPVYYSFERAWFRLTLESTRERISLEVAIEMMHAVYGDAYDHRTGLSA